MAYSETVEVLGNVVCDKMEPIYRNGHAKKSHWWAALYTVLWHFQGFDLYRKEKDLGSENDKTQMSITQPSFAELLPELWDKI